MDELADAADGSSGRAGAGCQAAASPDVFSGLQQAVHEAADVPAGNASRLDAKGFGRLLIDLNFQPQAAIIDAARLAGRLQFRDSELDRAAAGAHRDHGGKDKGSDHFGAKLSQTSGPQMNTYMVFMSAGDTTPPGLVRKPARRGGRPAAVDRFPDSGRGGCSAAFSVSARNRDSRMRENRPGSPGP